MSPKSRQMAPKWLPNGAQKWASDSFCKRFFSGLFSEPKKGVASKLWGCHLGTFSACFRQKVDPGRFFGCPGAVLVFRKRFRAFRGPNYMEKWWKKDSKTQFFPTWNTLFSYGFYCLKVTWVVQRGCKKTYKKQACKKSGKGRFASRFWAPFWDTFGTTFATFSHFLPKIAQK